MIALMIMIVFVLVICMIMNYYSNYEIENNHEIYSKLSTIYEETYSELENERISSFNYN